MYQPHAKQLFFEPDSSGIRSIAQRKVDGVHQALTSLVEADARTHAVHGVTTRHELVLLCLLPLHQERPTFPAHLSKPDLLASEKFQRRMDHNVMYHSTNP